MLTLHKIYKDEFSQDFMRDFLDTKFNGKKYLFGTNDTAAQLSLKFKIDGFINTIDNELKEFMQKPVLHRLDEIDSNALVISCVHLGAAAADILLSAFSFRHLDCFAFSKIITVGGGV